MVHEDALALAETIVSGERSCVEVMQETLEKTDAINKRIHAAACLNPELALSAAQEKDKELARLNVSSRRVLLQSQPFFGVPSLLKDIGTAAEGIPSLLGTRLAGPIHWAQDSNLVKRYKAAGLLFYGRSTSSEFAVSPTTESPVYGGPTRNPWSTGHSAGGSSGGAAAAVASGMVRIAHASDGAGSIRIPASCCGVLGLKPSRGLVPMGPNRGEGWGGLSVKHVISHTVRDSAAALDISAGADLGAPYAAPVLPDSCRTIVEDISADPHALAPLRIAIVPQKHAQWTLHEDVAATLSACAEFLSRCGHDVDIAAPTVSPEQILNTILPLVACGAAASINKLAVKVGKSISSDDLQPTVRSMLAYAQTISGEQYAGCIDQSHAHTRSIARFFDGSVPDGSSRKIDILVSPVLSAPPALLGKYGLDWEDYLDYRIGPQGLIRYSPFAPMANMTGQPSIAVPFGTSSQGLPIGMQFTAAFGQEIILLKLAAQIEALKPWRLVGQ